MKHVMIWAPNFMNIYHLGPSLTTRLIVYQNFACYHQFQAHYNTQSVSALSDCEQRRENKRYHHAGDNICPITEIVLRLTIYIGIPSSWLHTYQRYDNSGLDSGSPPIRSLNSELSQWQRQPYIVFQTTGTTLQVSAELCLWLDKQPFTEAILSHNVI